METLDSVAVGLVIGFIAMEIIRQLWKYLPALPKRVRVHARFKRVMKGCGRCGEKGEIRYEPMPNSGMPPLIYPCSKCHGAREVFDHVAYRHPWLEPRDAGKSGKLAAEAEEVLKPRGTPHGTPRGH